MTEPTRGYVKHWSEYDRPAWAPPAPDLWDAVSAHGHISGPFATRAEATRHVDRCGHWIRSAGGRCARSKGHRNWHMSRRAMDALNRSRRRPAAGAGWEF